METMVNYFNIPENFEQSGELSGLLNRILNLLTIDMVFLSRPQEKGDEDGR